VSFRAQLFICGGWAVSSEYSSILYQPFLPTWFGPVTWNNQIIGWGFTISVIKGSYWFQHYLYSYHVVGVAGYATGGSNADVTANLLGFTVYTA
jgi:hypothetical protein